MLHNSDGWTAWLGWLRLFIFFKESNKRLGQYTLSVVLINFWLTRNSLLEMLVVDVNRSDGEVDAALSVQPGS